MSIKIELHQGEILRLLIKRAGLKVDDVAPKLGMLPNSLSRLFKSERIKPAKRRLAAQLLEIDESIFETGIGYEIPSEDTVANEPDVALRTRLELLEYKMKEAQEELKRLREEAANKDPESMRTLLEEIKEKLDKMAG